MTKLYENLYKLEREQNKIIEEIVKDQEKTIRRYENLLENKNSEIQELQVRVTELELLVDDTECGKELRKIQHQLNAFFDKPKETFETKV